MERLKLKSTCMKNKFRYFKVILKSKSKKAEILGLLTFQSYETLKSL